MCIVMCLPCVSVCLNIHQRGSEWTEFCENWYCGLLRESTRKLILFLSRTLYIRRFYCRQRKTNHNNGSLFT